MADRGMPRGILQSGGVKKDDGESFNIFKELNNAESVLDSFLRAAKFIANELVLGTPTNGLLD